MSCIQVVFANIESIVWTVVLPIPHILGRVPLMRLYLAGSVQPTIPHSLAVDKDPYFEHGCADRAGRSGIGSGSRLFEINVQLWKYGRPQPRTMSVQERLDRKAARMTCRAPRGMEGVTCRARFASRTRTRTRTQAPAHARAPARARPRARTAARPPPRDRSRAL